MKSNIYRAVAIHVAVYRFYVVDIVVRVFSKANPTGAFVIRTPDAPRAVDLSNHEDGRITAWNLRLPESKIKLR